MLFNRKSREVSLDRSWKDALMHDGWVTTRTFAEKGIVYAMPEALLEYRNHGDNTIGATDGSRFTIGYRISHFGQMLRLNMKQYRMLRHTIRINGLCHHGAIGRWLVHFWDWAAHKVVKFS